MSKITEHIDALELKNRLRQTPKRYKREKTEYNGIMYDCKEEARLASRLDLMVKGKMILSWQNQAKLLLRPAMFGSRPCTHKIDFMVNLSSKMNGDFNYIYIEIKKILKSKRHHGREDEAGRLRRLWAESILKEPIRVCETAKQAEKLIIEKLEELENEK